MVLNSLIRSVAYMPNPTRPPVFSILESAESIYSMRKKFRLILLWALYASIWIILISGLFVAYIVSPGVFKMYEIYAAAILTILIGIPLFLAAIFVLPYSWEGANKIENFMSDFHPTWVKMQVELGNVEGDDIEKKIFNTVTKIMPKYRILKGYSTRSRTILKNFGNFDLIFHKGRKLGLIITSPHDSNLNKEDILNVEKDISTKCKKLHLNLKFFVLVQEDYEENLKEWDDEDKLTKNGVMVLFLTKQNTELGVKWVSSIRVKKSLLN